MFTFFCAGCGEYLKKKQAEDHPRLCIDVLSCIECWRDFRGSAQIKAHTNCHPPTQPRKDPRAEQVRFAGVRNTARRIVRATPDQRMDLPQLRRRLEEAVRRAGRSAEELGADLASKLSVARNLRVEGQTVVYCREA